MIMSKKFLVLIKDDYIDRFKDDLNCSRKEVIEHFDEEFKIEHKGGNKFIINEDNMEKYLYSDEYKIIKEV